MKRFFSLTTVLLLMLFLLYQSTSFTTAEIKNEATLSMVSEGNALIALSYEEGRMFIVTNNTGKSIEIEGIRLMNSPANDISNAEEKKSSIIEPGESSAFTINGNPTHLLGDSIQMIARWDGGNAEIQSMLPEFYIEQLVRGFEEGKMELAAVEVELTEEQATSEICKEKAASEIDEEKVIPAICEEKVEPEIDKEKMIPETNEVQLAPELSKDQPIPEINDEQ